MIWIDVVAVIGEEFSVNVKTIKLAPSKKCEGELNSSDSEDAVTAISLTESEKENPDLLMYLNLQKGLYAMIFINLSGVHSVLLIVLIVFYS